MRFQGLDLNLIVALDVLLVERNVSRAAERLGLSQPATSAALSRLRDFFRDDLLVQHGKKMFSTPYADGLAPQLRAFLRSASELVATSAVFDPLVTNRTFRIVASDYLVVAVFPPLIARLAVEAPGIHFEFVPPDLNATAELHAGKADLQLAPDIYASEGLMSELLFEERHVVVGCRDHPLFNEPITEERLLACGQVVVQLGATRQRTFADAQLQKLGKPFPTEVIVGTFASVPWLLVGTMRLAIMHERLAREMVQRFPIKIAPLPFAFPMMREMMAWHPVRALDEGMLWLRANIRAQVADGRIIHRTDRKRSK